MTEEATSEGYLEAPPETPSVRKPKAKAASGPQYVKVINVHKADVVLTGEDGKQYRLHPREQGTCLATEAENPKRGKHPCLEVLK